MLKRNIIIIIIRVAGMAMSVKERQRRWKRKQAETGKRAVTVSMTPEAYAALRAIRKETGCNFSTIINQAVTGNIVRCEATSAVSRGLVSPEPLPDPDDGGGPWASAAPDGKRSLG